MKVFFLHGRDFSNAGDIASCPYEYFDFFKGLECRFVDLCGACERHGRSGMIWTEVASQVTSEDVVVVGGGGLVGFADSWHEAINRLTSRAGKAVGWGFGRNFSGEDRTKVKLDLGRFRLLGTRDSRDPVGGRYVPCVSCMHPQFRAVRGPKKRKRGIVLHKDEVTPAGGQLAAFLDGADLACNAMDVRSLIRFLSECEEVCSNSYHVCYWSALLNVPVRTIGRPTSRKLLDAGFDYCGGDNSGFYLDCVERNRKFSEEVRKLILG